MASGPCTAALRATAAPVVGISPVDGDAPVRGFAHKLLPAVGARTSAAVERVRGPGIACRAVPLLMTGLDRTRAMAARALEPADFLGR
ncbi:CofD/YvcK family protein [Actinosynnema pretiosum]|uniref:hypothetical protein n=1 Tax=Actinosynnema pretiosum TaxID=42197 RepID=UPI000B0FDBBD